MLSYLQFVTLPGDGPQQLPPPESCSAAHSPSVSTAEPEQSKTRKFEFKKRAAIVNAAFTSVATAWLPAMRESSLSALFSRSVLRLSISSVSCCFSWITCSTSTTYIRHNLLIENTLFRSKTAIKHCLPSKVSLNLLCQIAHKSLVEVFKVSNSRHLGQCVLWNLAFKGSMLLSLCFSKTSYFLRNVI